MSFSFFVFVFLPILELVTFILVGREIGWGDTLLLTLTPSLLGVVLTRSRWIRTHGLAAAARSNSGAGDGLSPALHQILAYLGGILLIFPGFLTDLAGLVLLFPFGRRGLYRIMTKWFFRGQTANSFFSFGANPLFHSFFFGDGGGFSSTGAPQTDDSPFYDAEFAERGDGSPAHLNDDDGGDVIDVDFTVRREK